MPSQTETSPIPEKAPGAMGKEDLDRAIERATGDLLGKQRNAGEWSFDFEADATITAEYILMMHFTGDVDTELQTKMARYLRRLQNEEGGWPLYAGGAAEISCSVKTYYALKLAGDDPEDAHMRMARDCILRSGGAARSNVFTRIRLAMFGQLPWRGVPYIPVEMVLLPKWFPFHLQKVSYWSRTVMVPLFILCTRKAQANNPSGKGVRELFTVPPEEERNYFPVWSWTNHLFFFTDRMGKALDRFVPRRIREKAERRALDWFTARLNGIHGLGAIFPAMVNAYEALAVTARPEDAENRETARAALRNLVVERGGEAFCQPCVSPVWDTALAALALQETGDEAARPAAKRGLKWLRERQLLEFRGDWAEYRPGLEGGGWPFQYRNDYYPDLDDTAVVAFAMKRDGDPAYAPAVRRAARWLIGMQSKDGGFASFDADNTFFYLNEIPFADHGALLDPPTADVSARCAMLFGALGEGEDPAAEDSLRRVLRYLEKEQEPDGCWFGRWGTNYIYGTWSVLLALEQCGESKNAPRVRRAVEWLKQKQRSDGSWGETNDSYFDPSLRGESERGTSFQTAWALLALMAAGEAESEAVRRGIARLLATQTTAGNWDDPEFTCPGFPRVFYLKYHGYDDYFPLWALARYRNEIRGGSETVSAQAR